MAESNKDLELLQKLNDDQGFFNFTPEEMKRFESMPESKQITAQMKSGRLAREKGFRDARNARDWRANKDTHEDHWKKALGDALKKKQKKTKISADSLKKGAGYMARVHGKGATGEYLSPEERKVQFKKTKISAEAFKKGSSVGGAQKVAADTTGASAMVPYKAPTTDIDKSLQPEEGKKGGELTEFQGILKKIAGTVDSIHDTLVGTAKQDKKEGKLDNKEAENKRRNLRESILESKVFKGVASGVRKVLAPVQGMFSKLIKFITTLLTGKIVLNILKWWGDPANAGKADAIIRFVSDWWPVFAAGLLIFGTGLGTVVGGLVSLVVALTPKLLAATVALMSNPWVLAAVGLGLAAWGISSLVSGHSSNTQAAAQSVKGDDKGLDTTPSTEIQQGAAADQGAVGGKEQKFAKGGLVQSEPVQRKEYAKGGTVTGPSGTDKVPARLTAGEFVMSKGAVNKWGVGTLSAMNSAGGGTNRPISGGYFGGGFVLDKLKGIPKDNMMESLMMMQQVLVESAGSISNVTNILEGSNNIDTTNDINNVTTIKPPDPPATQETEVQVVPAMPTPASEGENAPAVYIIPPFNTTAEWIQMDNKIKTLGFTR